MRLARIGLAVLKGTQHEAHRAIHLSEQGPHGDRAFCLIDPVHRRVLKTVAHGSLLGARATWQQGVLTVELAAQTVAGVPVRTGETVEVDYWGRRIRADIVGGPWAEAFSRHLGRSVILAGVGPGDIVYGDQVSVITTASLAGLRAVSRGGPPSPHRALDVHRDSARFRSTFVVDTGAGPYAEAGSEMTWVGQVLLLGAVRVCLTAPVVRCGVVDLHPTSGHRDLHLLAALPRNAAGEPVFGLQGRVVRPGLVRQDVPVALSAGRG